MSDSTLELKLNNSQGKVWEPGSVNLPIYPQDFDIRSALLHASPNDPSFSIDVPMRTPVRAIANGEVRRSDYHEDMPHNSLIILSHGNPSRLASYYQGIVPSTDLGKHVKAGDVIGYSIFPKVTFSLHNHPMASPELAPIVQYLRSKFQ